MIIALWSLAAIVAYHLAPLARKKKPKILCAGHAAKELKVGQMAILDSTRCHLCAKEGKKKHV